MKATTKTAKSTMASTCNYLGLLHVLSPPHTSISVDQQKHESRYDPSQQDIGRVQYVQFCRINNGNQIHGQGNEYHKQHPDKVDAGTL